MRYLRPLLEGKNIFVQLLALIVLVFMGMIILLPILILIFPINVHIIQILHLKFLFRKVITSLLRQFSSRNL